jgi:hypothetical protein
VLRVAGQTETMQQSIQDWLELNEGDRGSEFPVFLQFLNKSSTVIFFYLFSSALCMLLNFQFICFLSVFFAF